MSPGVIRMTRRAEGRLRKFIEGSTPASGTLPLVHITRAYTFDDIVRGDMLDPTHCDVFNESLIYFFYGRPAYRAKDGNNARLEFEWPIVLVFDPEKIVAIKRIFPFDTGAFTLKMYEEFFDKHAIISDFEIEPTLDSARKLVGTFYTDHKEYFHGLARKNVQLRSRQFEAQGILELSRLPGMQGSNSTWGARDERSSAIEVQTDAPVSLIGSLIAVVLPEPYLDDDEIKQALARWNVPIIEAYTTLHNLGGEAWTGQIYQIVKKIFERQGLL
jgi:hypothetical protein